MNRPYASASSVRDAVLVGVGLAAVILLVFLRNWKVMLIATLFFGSVFLGVKGYEYHAHWNEGLFPGSHFTWHENPALASKVQLFMIFYWGLTGLHALHMVIGVGLLLWIISRAWRSHFSPEYYSPVEVMGLYWHFVDIVWIFLFPFLYLIPHFGVLRG